MGHLGFGDAITRDVRGSVGCVGRNGEWVVVLLIAAPIVLGLVALGGAIGLFVTTKRDTRDRIPRLVAASILLTIGLGVVACYGWVFSQGVH
jgi:hypothetical protein